VFSFSIFHKCNKTFVGYQRTSDSVTCVLFDLSLPRYDTVILNSRQSESPMLYD